MLQLRSPALSASGMQSKSLQVGMHACALPSKIRPVTYVSSFACEVAGRLWRAKELRAVACYPNKSLVPHRMLVHGILSWLSHTGTGP